MGVCTKVRKTSIVVSIYKLLAQAAAIVSSIGGQPSELQSFQFFNDFFSAAGRARRNVKECGN